VRAVLIGEMVQVRQAQIFVAGRLWLPEPPYPEFFSSLNMVDAHGRVFAQFPPGGPAFLALGEAVGAGWIVNPLFGAISVVAFAAMLRVAEPNPRTAALATQAGVHLAAAALAFAATLVVTVQTFRGEAAPAGSWRDYVPLTRPRIMSLLLLTGLGGMFSRELLASNVALAEGRAEWESRARMLSAELDELKGEFLSNVSHELRTPLTVILGNARTLADRWEDLPDSIRIDLVTRLAATGLTLGAVGVLFAGASPIATAQSAAPKAYIGLFGDNAVGVLDTATNQVTKTIPIPTGPHGLVITPDNKWVYASSDGDSVVSVISTASDEVTTSVDVGTMPHGLAITPDGSRVLVAGFGTDQVEAIDPGRLAEVGGQAAATFPPADRFEFGPLNELEKNDGNFQKLVMNQRLIPDSPQHQDVLVARQVGLDALDEDLRLPGLARTGTRSLPNRHRRKVPGPRCESCGGRRVRRAETLPAIAPRPSH